jgi:hypothetical protein
MALGARSSNRRIAWLNPKTAFSVFIEFRIRMSGSEEVYGPTTALPD